MNSERNSIDVLAEALRKSCGLFNQLVSEHTRLRKLESHDPPTDPCIRRVNGKGQILTAEQAITYDDAKTTEQSLVVHGVEHDFLAAVQDTKEAIRHPGLTGAIEPTVDKPAHWLAELLGEIKSMELAALWPYPRDDDPPQANTLTPEDRMAALIVVQQRLNHLDCSQEVGARPTPTEDKPKARGDKPTLTIHIADMTATLGTVQYRFDQTPQWDAMKKMAHLPGCTVRITAAQATRLRKLLRSTLPDVAKAIYCQHKGRYAIRTSDFLVDVIEPVQPPEN